MDLYKLDLKSDGLFVILNNNLKQSLKILEKELFLRNIQADYYDLEKWFKTSPGQAYKLSEIKELDLEGKFEIIISEDLLTANLTFFPALNSSQNISINEIKTALINKGITFGIDEVKIIMALAENKLILNLPIAKGREPVPGRNAVIKYYFNEKGIELKPKELENGKVDFYNINLIQIVKKDQLLVEKIPATKGISGITVTGKEIPAANGKDIILPLGKNMTISEDSLKGYAACEGHVVVVDRRVSVLPIFEVNGDVDFSTGNIDFIGNVVIKGNLKDGFSVKAQGDVEVFGTVEGGHITSSGNIFIKKGVRGLKKSKIEAQGNIYSNFVEYANISAGGDIIINEAIMHSVVNSDSIIQVGGKKGLVVGGTYRAGRALICKNIGSNLATFTNIEVGLKPNLSVENKEICQNLRNIRENLDKTIKGIKILSDIQKKLGKLPPDKNTLFKKLLKVKDQLKTQEENLLLYKQKIEEQNKILEESYVEVSGVINCGVNITIGRANKHFTTEQYKVKLTQKGVDISVSPLNEYKGE